MSARGEAGTPGRGPVLASTAASFVLHAALLGAILVVRPVAPRATPVDVEIVTRTPPPPTPGPAPQAAEAAPSRPARAVARARVLPPSPAAQPPPEAAAAPAPALPPSAAPAPALELPAPAPAGAPDAAPGGLAVAPAPRLATPGQPLLPGGTVAAEDWRAGGPVPRVEERADARDLVDRGGGRGSTRTAEAQRAEIVEAILDEVHDTSVLWRVEDSVLFPGIGPVRADKVCVTPDGATFRAVMRGHDRKVCDQEVLDYSETARSAPKIVCVRWHVARAEETILEAPVRYKVRACVMKDWSDSKYPGCFRWGEIVKEQPVTYTYDTFTPDDSHHLVPIHHRRQMPVCAEPSTVTAPR